MRKRKRKQARPQAVAGIAFLKAPRRRLIALRGNFVVSPKQVERVRARGKMRHSYQELPHVPYVDAAVTSASTRKWPEELTTLVVELCDGRSYVLQTPVAVAGFRGRQLRMRFEGVTCEEVR